MSDPLSTSRFMKDFKGAIAKAGKLPDVHLTEELCVDATIEQRYSSPQCCKNRTGIDTQSDYGEKVRCNSPSVIKIRLATGQYYDLCEDHARELGVLHKLAKIKGASE